MATSTKNMELIETTENYSTLLSKLENGKRFGINFASQDLGRSHKISFAAVVLESEPTVWIIDVQKCGLLDRFKKVLEDKTIEKLVYDCRQDSDCLSHQYNCALAGVIDMQIMHYISMHPDRTIGNKLIAFGWILADLFGQTATRKSVNLLKAAKRLPKEEMNKRPINGAFLNFAVDKLGYYFRLYEILKNKISNFDLEEIKIFSDRYADSKRSLVEYDIKNRYFFHAFMPWGIFEDVPTGDFRCAGCRGCFGAQVMVKSCGRVVCQICKSVDKWEAEFQARRSYNYDD